ncbi:MerR family transcriptional regulator [Bacillus mangrovi]|uniref:MerR family transcriptional regulator n=1 Tax=Metabacillus mangrovi TaxID=1491830 RepID=A0A7X2V6A1_9BACI|nr:MerR family transcriptional regulator [Metabacillus mangrovi]MTH55290.1 MerR family transcriptional regulator [Metabacillus mangrovi]
MSLTIKEASEKVGMSSHTIRFYEKQGLLPSLKRDSAGYRLFTDHDIEWLDFISCLRKTDIPITELKKIMDLTVEGNHTIQQRKKILLTHREAMLEKQNELDRAFQKIDKKLKYFNDLESRLDQTDGDASSLFCE